MSLERFMYFADPLKSQETYSLNLNQSKSTDYQ